MHNNQSNLNNNHLMQVSLFSLNVQNLKSNLIYPRYLAEISEILYLNELWLKEYEINIVRSLAPKTREKNVLFQSDMSSLPTRGRPHGGQAWILDKTLKIKSHSFLNKHVSYVKITKQSFEFLVIGVYLPFYDPNNRLQSQSMFDLSLTLIEKTIEENTNMPTFIIGDFNADPYRNNKFDKIFRNFIEKLKLVPLNTLLIQKISYSFSSNILNSSDNLNLDHSLYLCGLADPIINIQCNIEEDFGNLSDHNAISTTITLDKLLTDIPKVEKKIERAVDFKNQTLKTAFNHSLDNHADRINDLLLLPIMNELTNQQKIDKLYELIVESIRDANNSASELQNILKPCKKFNPDSDRKKWFTPEMNVLKKQIIDLKKIPDSNSLPLKNQIKLVRKQFRQSQRRNIFKKEADELRQLENVANLKDKNKFWKFIKKSRNSRANQNEVSIPSSDLFTHYSNFFKQENRAWTDEQQNISKKVKNIFNSFTKPTKCPSFNILELEMVIKETNNSNVLGNDKVSYNMLKNITSAKFISILLDLFNYFIHWLVIPTNLNISIIKPILKDQKKPSNSINNIRPLSISNSLAQIFEKLILLKSPKLLKMHKNQFGLKKKTSCNHAIFILKETLLKYIENGSACKVASLDAEKAFDKVWRDGLFLCLYDKMDPTLWFLLKKYYDSSKGIILSDSPETQNTEFPISCGVKQGGILSPFLFNIFYK